MTDTAAKISVSAAAGILGAVIETVFGGWCYHMTVLVILMCIDFLTGLVVAAFFGKSNKSATGGLSSLSCWKGLLKKVCTMLIVAAAYQADRIIGIDFTRSAVVIGFCVSELISICENAKDMDIFPPLVKKAFDKMFNIANADGDKKEDK